MVTLQADIHFWTFRDDIIVKDADIGAFKYQEKSNWTKERVYFEDKKCFSEARGIVVHPKNSRPDRFRDSIKELEELLVKEKVIYEKWRTNNIYQLIVSSGLIINLTVNTTTADLMSVTFDKFLVGKLLSEHIADVLITNSYMMISYNECRLTVVHFGKLIPESETFARLSSYDPKVSTFEADGPTGRRFQRKLCSNACGDMVVIWWHTSDGEIYPWSPVSRDRNRANILVYSFMNGVMELLCYCRTELSPLSVMFSKTHPNTLLTVEQGFVKKGEVTVTSCVYKVEKNSLQRTTYSTIPLEAPLTAHAHNPSEDCLLLACNNGVLSLHSDDRGMTHITKAALIPTNISWLDSSAIVVVSNGRGQIQCFDLALSLVRLQIVSENNNPQKMLDLSDYFYHQQSLEKIIWAPVQSNNDNVNLYNSHILMLHFSQGPLTCIKFESGQGTDKGFSIYTLTTQYIRNYQVDEALNLLVSLNWNKDGTLALKCLTTILNHLFKIAMSPQCESQMEACLGTFHVPVQPLLKTTKEEFGSPVRILTRKFFFKVLRIGRIEKAYRIALDLKDYDCFLYVYHVAQRRGDHELAAAALASTRELESELPGCDSCSSVLYRDSCDSSCLSQSCSDSCSSCFSESESDTQPQDDKHPNADEETLADRAEKSKVQMASTSSENVPPKRDPMSYVVSSPANLVQPVPGSSHHAPSTMTSAITSEDGTVTINIRQSDVPIPIPPPPFSLRHASSRPGSVNNDRKSSEDLYHFPAGAMPDAAVHHIEKSDLQNQYERTFYQELSTEDEAGGTVKVVHFGVV